MKKDDVIGVLVTAALGIVTIGSSILLTINGLKENQRRLDYVYGSKWWVNLMGNVIVKVLRVYPKSRKIVYTKYSETGRNLGTCQMDFDRFINTYGHARKNYRF